MCPIVADCWACLDLPRSFRSFAWWSSHPMDRIVSVFQRCRTDRAGAALVEFALIAPVLISLLGGAVDLGGAIALSLRVENAAHTGAQYATRMPSDTTGAATV